MNYKAKTVYIFSSHPLLNWAMGVLFASIVSIFVVMIIESYLINGRISDCYEKVKWMSRLFRGFLCFWVSNELITIPLMRQRL